MSIYYIIGILSLIFVGAFNFFKQKYIKGCILILIGVLTYGILNKSTKQEVLVVACSPDYKPFCYLKNGDVTGLDIEIIQEVAAKLNKKIEFKVMGFNFVFEEIKQNKSDIAISGLGINEERKIYLNFSIPYLSNEGTCGILTKKNIILNKDFNGVIGIQMGANSFKEIVKEKFPKATIIEIEDFMMLLESFKNNMENINVIVSDTIVLIDYLENQKNNFDEYKIYKTDMPNMIGTGFLLSNKININEFNNILQKTIETNKELKILKKKLDAIDNLE